MSALDAGAPVRVDAVAVTDAGLVRKINEDRFCTRDDVAFWAVADGMGGHAHGDWAANAVVQAIESAAAPPDLEAATQAFADAVHSANRRIWSESQRRAQQMGSTVVGLLVRGQRFAALWVGDSRAYILRDDTLHPLTTDHSQVQELVDRGLITAEEALQHPRRHVLARAVGVGVRLSVDVVTDEVMPGDRFLLCSDGLTGVLDDAAIARIVGGQDRQAAIDGLLAAAIDAGAPDNVTVILLDVRETTVLRPAGAAP